MSEKTTLIIEPGSTRGLLNLIDVLAVIQQWGVMPDKSERVSTSIIISSYPELLSFLSQIGATEWSKRRVVSPKGIIFDIYHLGNGSSCFLILSTKQVVYTTDRFNMFFPDD